MSDTRGNTGSTGAVNEDPRNQTLDRAERYDKGRPILWVKGARAEIAFVAPNRFSAYRVLTIGSKEPETIRWLNGMTADDVLFDIGANIGLFSLYGAVEIGCRVFAFEPEARNFGLLNENIGANNVGDRCLAYCLGISDRSGLSTILLSQELAGGSGHQVQGARSGSFGLGGREVRTQGIQTVSLDELVHAHGFPMPSHIKIDVDGLEHAIVEGGKKVLGDRRLKSVMIELALNIQKHEAVIGQLEALGFRKDAEMEDAVRGKTEGVAYTGNVLFTRI